MALPRNCFARALPRKNLPTRFVVVYYSSTVPFRPFRRFSPFPRSDDDVRPAAGRPDGPEIQFRSECAQPGQKVMRDRFSGVLDFPIAYSIRRFSNGHLYGPSTKRWSPIFLPPGRPFRSGCGVDGPRAGRDSFARVGATVCVADRSYVRQTVTRWLTN